MAGKIGKERVDFTETRAHAPAEFLEPARAGPRRDASLSLAPGSPDFSRFEIQNIIPEFVVIPIIRVS